VSYFLRGIWFPPSVSWVVIYFVVSFFLELRVAFVIVSLVHSLLIAWLSFFRSLFLYWYGCVCVCVCVAVVVIYGCVFLVFLYAVCLQYVLYVFMLFVRSFVRSCFI